MKLESEEGRAFVETSRAALAEALHAASLGTSARALEALPPAGVEGWLPAWVASLGFTKATAERWELAVREVTRCAPTGTDRSKLARLGGELATVVKDAVVLLAQLSTASDA